MRTEIRAGAKSTPEHPAWVWRVWHNSREVAFGISPTEEDAREQAQTAVDARRRRLGYSWEIVAYGEHER